MTRDEFDALIRKLETISQRSPKGFLIRVVGLVLLAYSYLGLVLVGSFTICLGIIILIVRVPNAATIKLGLFGLVICGGLFWAVLRGLWVRLDPPKGQAVTRAQAPKLFAMLDELRTALDCQPFHQVFIVAEHNACVIQVPRLGVFGWHQNYLLLGLPLLYSLAPDEFKAVLAHEFAHSSRGHGRFSNWLYRVRRSWDRIFEQMARQQTRGGVVLSSFIKWFWPVFNGHAFVLSRVNEYEADACSVRLAGAEAAANALLRLPVDGSFLEEKFWPHIFTRTKSEKEPPPAVMLLQADAIKSGVPAEDAARWLRQAFQQETNNSDTHPCLKDRLRAMGKLPAELERGGLPTPPAPPAETAAEFFLGSHAEVAARLLSEEWLRAVAPIWTQRHERTVELNRELAALDTPVDRPPTPDELWNKAVKLIELHDDAAAQPALEQVLTLDPKHAGANFVRGRQLLEQDDPAGVNFLETAMAADPSATQDACNLLYGFYSRTGQRERLRQLEERVDRFQEVAAKAQRERSNVTVADDFLPPDLNPEQLAALQKIFASEPDLASAAVARKQVEHFPTRPCYVIGLRIGVAAWKLRSSQANQKLVDRVLERVQLPGNFLVFVAEDTLKSLGKKIFATPTAVIYERAPTPPPLP